MRDLFGSRLKMGIVLPSTNTTMQPETESLRPMGVSNHTSRMLIRDSYIDKEPGFQNVISDIRVSTSDAILSVATCKPNRIILGVSPESYWEGPGSHEMILKKFQEVSNGIPITTSPDAFKVALRKLGNLKRIAVLTPYLPIGDNTVSNFFTDNGYDVVSIKGLGGMTPSRISHITEENIFEAIKEVNNPSVQAIVQVGTNVAMARAAMIAEKWINKPVLSNNVVLYWHALRESGVMDKMENFGQLLVHH